MNKIVVKVHRCGEWRKVQSFEYSAKLETNRRRGDATEYCRAGAIKVAQGAVAAWQASDQFTSLDLRLIDLTGYYGEERVVS